MASQHTSGGKVDPRVAPAETYDAFFPEWSKPLLDSALASSVDDEKPAGTTDVNTGRTTREHTEHSGENKRDEATRIDPDVPLEKQCQKILALLREHCPEIVPPGPVRAGEITPPIDLKTEHLESLVLAAVGVDDKRKRNQVIWEQAGSELLIHLKRTRVAVLDGLILVGIIVESIETERSEVIVPFAVGRPERLAGMVVATEPVPRGPTAIIDRWGDALIAFAWQVLVDVINTIAARTGVDTIGAPLVPGAIVAANGTLRVIPQAQHEYERSRR